MRESGTAQAPDGRNQTAFQPAGAGWPLAERLRNFTNHFRYFCEDCYKQWVRFAKIRGVEADLPFATTPGARREAGYFVLPIASGDLVVTDPAFTGWLLSHDRKRAVVEMESAGAARAVQEYDRDVALLVLRGISDFADGRKAELDAVLSGSESGAWRRYAAENAVELLFAFLAAPNFPWRGSATPPVGQPEADLAIGAVDAPAAPSARAWDYFMRAARLVEVTPDRRRDRIHPMNTEITVTATPMATGTTAETTMAMGTTMARITSTGSNRTRTTIRSRTKRAIILQPSPIGIMMLHRTCPAPTTRDGHRVFPCTSNALRSSCECVDEGCHKYCGYAELKSLNDRPVRIDADSIRLV